MLLPRGHVLQGSELADEEYSLEKQLNIKYLSSSDAVKR